MNRYTFNTTYTCTGTEAYTYTYACTYAYAFTFTYTYTYINTCTCTCKYAYLQPCPERNGGVSYFLKLHVRCSMFHVDSSLFNVQCAPWTMVYGAGPPACHPFPDFPNVSHDVWRNKKNCIVDVCGYWEICKSASKQTQTFTMLKSTCFKGTKRHKILPPSGTKVTQKGANM